MGLSLARQPAAANVCPGAAASQALRCRGCASRYRRRSLLSVEAENSPAKGSAAAEKAGCRAAFVLQSLFVPERGERLGVMYQMLQTLISTERYRLLKKGAEETQHIVNNMCLIFFFLNILLKATP